MIFLCGVFKKLLTLFHTYGQTFLCAMHFEWRTCFHANCACWKNETQVTSSQTKLCKLLIFIWNLTGNPNSDIMPASSKNSFEVILTGKLIIVFSGSSVTNKWIRQYYQSCIALPKLLWYFIFKTCIRLRWLNLLNRIPSSKVVCCAFHEYAVWKLQDGHFLLLHECILLVKVLFLYQASATWDALTSYQ